ncbi:MAG: hypothetical protein ACI9G1_003400 [Pirellulaceae bacterium]|jgi:hypothetical protein
MISRFDYLAKIAGEYAPGLFGSSFQTSLMYRLPLKHGREFSNWGKQYTGFRSP